MGFSPFGNDRFTKRKVPTLVHRHVVASLAGGILMLKSLKSINQFLYLVSYDPSHHWSGLGPLSHGDSLVGDSKANWFFGFGTTWKFLMSWWTTWPILFNGCWKMHSIPLFQVACTILRPSKYLFHLVTVVFLVLYLVLSSLCVQSSNGYLALYRSLFFWMMLTSSACSDDCYNWKLINSLRSFIRSYLLGTILVFDPCDSIILALPEDCYARLLFSLSYTESPCKF